jgi:hypothetical protein
MALSLQPPKASKPKQARDGLCSVLGKRMTPEAGLEELKTTKANARLPCWLHLHPSVKPIDSKDPSKGKQVVLTCDQCERDLKPSNVSQLGTSHFDEHGNCKAANKKAGRVSGAGSSNSSNSATAAAAGGSKPMPSFLAAPTLQKQALDSLTKYLVGRGCPSHVEDDNLKAAFAALGCDMPSEYHNIRPACMHDCAAPWAPVLDAAKAVLLWCSASLAVCQRTVEHRRSDTMLPQLPCRPEGAVHQAHPTAV